MNNGAFGENFPYSNFHDLNMDWIIKIAKDFLDQYTHIQDTITQGLEDLEEKATTLEALLQQWYDTHSEDIAKQLADALEDLNNWYSEHVAEFDQHFSDTITAFNQQAGQKAAQTIASIPSDYTTLFNKVNEIDSALSHTFEYSSSLVKYNYNVRGYRINTDVNVGETLDLTPTSISNTAWGYIIVDCEPEDIFYIDVSATNSYRSWLFIDADNKVLQKTGSATGTTAYVIAPEGSKKLISNANGGNYICIKGIPFKYQIDNLSKTLPNIRQNNRISNIDGVFSGIYINFHQGAITRLGVKNIALSEIHSDQFDGGFEYIIHNPYHKQIAVTGVKKTDSTIGYYYNFADSSFSSEAVYSTDEYISIRKYAALNYRIRINNDGEDLLSTQNIIQLYMKNIPTIPEQVYKLNRAWDYQNVPFEQGNVTTSGESESSTNIRSVGYIDGGYYVVNHEKLTFGVLVYNEDETECYGYLTFNEQVTPPDGVLYEDEYFIIPNISNLKYRIRVKQAKTTAEEIVAPEDNTMAFYKVQYPITNIIMTVPQYEGFSGQAICITDRYIYQAMIETDNASQKILQFDKYTHTLLKTITRTDLGHVNDMCWNPKNKHIYIAIANNSTIIKVVNEEFEDYESISTNLALSSIVCIAFDPITECWAIKDSPTNHAYILKHLNDSTAIYDWQADDNFLVQSFAFNNGVIYCGCTRDGNAENPGVIDKIELRSMSGTIITSYNIPFQYGEIEGVQIVGDSIIFNANNYHSSSDNYLTVYEISKKQFGVSLL